MDLNKLRTFTIVAEIGTITKAAAKLHRTQPAISAQLKDLERETKLQLFERKNSRIYLTKEGQTLYEHATTRIAELDDIILRLRDENENLEGTVRLGVQWELTKYLIPGIINDFKKLYPKIRFEIKTHDHARLERALLENEVDAALAIIYKQRHFFDIHPYLIFERSIVASPAYLKEIPPVKTYEDLLDLDIIGFTDRLPDFQYWLRINGQKHLIKSIGKISKPVIIKEISTMHELIKNGIGIGFADSLIMRKELKSGEIVKVIPASKPIYITIDISRRKVRTPNLLHDIFFDFMLERANTKQ